MTKHTRRSCILERVVTRTRHHQKASPRSAPLALPGPCTSDQAPLIAKTVGTTPAPQTQPAAPTYGYTLAPAEAPQRTSPTPDPHRASRLRASQTSRPTTLHSNPAHHDPQETRPHKPATGTAARAPESHNRTAMQDTHIHIARSSKLTANTHHQATPRPPDVQRVCRDCNEQWRTGMTQNGLTACAYRIRKYSISNPKILLLKSKY